MIYDLYLNFQTSFVLFRYTRHIKRVSFFSKKETHFIWRFHFYNKRITRTCKFRSLYQKYFLYIRIRIIFVETMKIIRLLWRWGSVFQNFNVIIIFVGRPLCVMRRQCVILHKANCASRQCNSLYCLDWDNTRNRNFSNHSHFINRQYWKHRFSSPYLGMNRNPIHGPFC